MRYNLRDYLNENLSISHQYKTSDIIFDRSRRYYFPISSMQSSGKITSLHVTNYSNLPSLIKLQGKKKSISTFNKMDGFYGFSTLLRNFTTNSSPTDPTIIAVLKGVPLISAQFDIMTIVDETGRRWAPLRNLIPDYELQKKLQDEIDKYRTKVYKQYNVISDKELYNKTKSLIIKLMIDKMNIMLKSMKSKIEASQSGESYNEVVLQRFTIEKIIVFSKEKVEIPSKIKVVYSDGQGIRELIAPYLK